MPSFASPMTIPASGSSTATSRTSSQFFALMSNTNGSPPFFSVGILLRYALTWTLLVLVPDLFLLQGFLGLIVSNPNGVAALNYPDSIQALCDARPSGVSIDTTEPGRRKRGEIDTLLGGDIIKRGAMGSRWSRKRMIDQRR